MSLQEKDKKKIEASSTGAGGCFRFACKESKLSVLYLELLRINLILPENKENEM